MMKPPFSAAMLRAARLKPPGRLPDAAGLVQRALGSRASGLRAPVLPRVMPRVMQGLMERGAPQPEVRVPDGAKFLARHYSAEAGRRPYKLFIPSGYHGQPVPLLVMLHGCTQSPDDFAVGTRMNEAAERDTLLVAYPEQIPAANHSRCWNWFNPADQARDTGEPALIAGIARTVMAEYAVDPRRVYVAGLSAGGAAAAVMGQAYPDLFAAIGVHSGLACGAATDVVSALAVMRQGGPEGRAGRRPIPAIVFHGDRDTTVHPRNGDAVLAQSAAAQPLRTRVERGQVAGGHAYRRSIHTDAAGHVVQERWIVDDAGHAWSGGSAAGSYTDPLGPDATGEMLRFFREHPRLE